MSRSGTLRQAIGPAKAHLRKTLLDAQAILAGKIPSEEELREQLYDQILEKKGLIQSQISALELKEQRWSELIEKIEDDDAAEKEEKLYTNAIHGSDGLAVVIQEARGSVSLLDTRAKKIERVNAASAGSSGAPPGAGAPPRARSDRKVNLPKLTLPTFSGDSLKWQEFWGLFSANVHNSELTDVEKFAYLRAQLAGVALQVIDGITISEENYGLAITTLQSRFEKSQDELICTYYSQLKRLPKSSIKVSDMQKTYDACERIFRLLANAGETVDTNRSLVLDVLNKFPDSTIKSLYLHGKIKPTSPLSQVRSALKEQIETSEHLEEVFDNLEPFAASSSKLARTKPEHQEVKPSGFEKPSFQKPTSALTVSESTEVKPKSQHRVWQNKSFDGAEKSDRRDRPPPPCYFCGGEHFNTQCRKYPSLEERVQRLKELKRCLRCMGLRHETSACDAADRGMFCSRCETVGDHRNAICPTRAEKKEGATGTTLLTRETKKSPSQEKSGSPERKSTSTMLNLDEQSLLMTALATVSNPQSGAHRKVRLILDTGSQRSYVTDECAEELGLKTVQQEAMEVTIFGAQRTLSIASRRVELNIELKDGNQRSISANTTTMITSGSVIPERLPDQTLKLIGSMRYALADDFEQGSGRVDMLIGTDHFWEFLSGTRLTISDGLYLIPTTLGLVLAGRYWDSSESGQQTTLLCLTESVSRQKVSSLNFVASESHLSTDYPDIDEFWRLETVGIKDEPCEADEKALEQFNSTIKFSDGRYQVKWPWKNQAEIDLPTNYQLALGRFKSLAKRLNDDPELKAKYQQVLDDQCQKSIIEQAEPIEKPAAASHLVHYLPHHPVVKLSSATTKVRIVYDASAKVRKDAKSLNECLYRGPVILPDLCGVLIRFRTWPLALVADLEKAFLQVALQEEDRDVTRFLWYKDPSQPEIMDNVAEFRFRRVPFGTISSPFLLGATVKYHLQKAGSPVANLINENIYVDNVICGADDRASAEAFYVEAKEIFHSAGMNLTEWCSNSDDLMEFIPASDRVKKREAKVLGISWNSESDLLQLQKPQDWDAKSVCLTKREALKSIASIYDPLGWFQPCTLRGKCFLRDLWIQDKAWDDPLDEPLQEQWRHIHQNLTEVFDVQVKRTLSGPGLDHASLVIFCDASAEAYATVAYLRTKSADGWKIDLLFSKSRLAPKKRSDEKVSIPQLELLGMTIGCKAAQYLRKALHDEDMPVTVLTDSSCVMGWLRSTKPLTVFVANRVRAMKELRGAEFRHVSTRDNPADHSTRGLTGSEIEGCQLWWSGPSWLKLDFVDWPVTAEVPNISEEDLEAIAGEQKAQPLFHTLLAGEGAAEAIADPLKKFPPPLRMTVKEYSSWRKLIRITAWCLKFVRKKVWNHLSAATQSTNPQLAKMFARITDESTLAAEDLRQAQTAWIKTIQRQEFGDVQKALQGGKSHQLVKQLNLDFDEDRVLRCVGRYQRSDLALDTAQPKLLPSNHEITNS